MKIHSIKEVKPRRVYAVTTSTGTFIADGLAHHNCYTCNIHRKGASEDYWLFMEKKYGREVIDELIAKKRVIMQRKAYEYLELAEEYDRKYQELLKS